MTDRCAVTSESAAITLNFSAIPIMQVHMLGADRAMEQESDLVYLDRRATEERLAAGCSDTRVVRDVHLEFASAYEFRLHLLRQMNERAAAKRRSANAAPGPELALANASPGQDLIQHQIPSMLGG